MAQSDIKTLHANTVKQKVKVSLTKSGLSNLWDSFLFEKDKSG